MTDVELMPLSGSPARLTDLAATAARLSGAVSTTGTDLRRLDGSMANQRSRAVDAARETVVALAAEADLIQEVLSTAARTLGARATALRSEQAAADRAVARRDEALDRVRQAEADESAAWREHALGSDVAAATHRVWEARARADHARADVAAAEADWRRARDARQTGSREAAARLDGFERVGAIRAAVASGVGPAAFQSRWQEGTRLADLVASIQPSGDRATWLAARADLVAAIDAAGDDHVLWTAFWTQVSPARLYAAFGTRPPEPELRATMADGLAAWAASATAAEQTALGRALVDELGDSPSTLEPRIRLLEGLLLAELPLTMYSGAGAALGERHGDAPVDDAVLTATAPVVVAVASALSTDPDVALAHLAPTDADAASQRARTWFGQVPPDGWPDGGVAVSGLLAVALLHGSSSPETAVQHQAALVATRATPELVGDRGLLTRRIAVADEAARRVAIAYEPYIPAFEESMTPDSAHPDTAVCLQPRLDQFELRRLIGATSDTPAAADRWLGATDRYVERVADGLGAPEDASGRNARAHDAIADAAVVAGGTRSPLILEARADQARTASALSWLNTGLGLSTAAARPGASLATTGAGMLLPPLIPDDVAEVRSAVLRDEPLLRERFAEPLHEAAAEADQDAGLDPHDEPKRLTVLEPDSDAVKGRFNYRYGVVADLREQMGEGS